jgi:formate dehydrogenase subunit gamma
VKDYPERQGSRDNKAMTFVAQYKQFASMRIFALGLFFLLSMILLLAAGPTRAQSDVNPPTSGIASSPELVEKPVGGNVPGDVLGSSSDAELWRAVRRGVQGNVSIPNEQAGVLIQANGENWRNFRNGPLSTYGIWGLIGIIGFLALFFLLRGRVKIQSGESGQLIERFNGIERFTHWMTAVSFIILAITGLNVLYGRYVILPALGPDVFSALTIAGKYAHNFLAFPFMLGVAMMFLLWIGHNIPNRHDLVWLAKGGGFFSKHSHPPARKFNAGQKIIFWLVVLTGLTLSVSGVALMFPFEISPWGKTFAVINMVGFDLPTNLTAMQEMQLSQLWHSVVALFIIAVILAHIYIGTIGMQGAFDAMGSGKVDINWAREHHNLWVEEQQQKASSDAHAQPAE